MVLRPARPASAILIGHGRWDLVSTDPPAAPKPRISPRDEASRGQQVPTGRLIPLPPPIQPATAKPRDSTDRSDATDPGDSTEGGSRDASAAESTVALPSSHAGLDVAVA